MVKLRASNSIGGLMIHLYYDETKQHGNGDVTVRAPKDGVSELAIAAIREAGMDASEELIEVCRQLVAATTPEEPVEHTPPWRQLKPEVQESLVESQIDDMRDSLKHYAQDYLDQLTLREIAEQELCAVMETDPTPEEMDDWIKDNLMEKPSEA